MLTLMPVSCLSQATIPGITCGPLTAELVTQSHGRWFPVFILAAGVDFVGAIVYINQSAASQILWPMTVFAADAGISWTFMQGSHHCEIRPKWLTIYSLHWTVIGYEQVKLAESFSEQAWCLLIGQQCFQQTVSDFESINQSRSVICISEFD